MMLCRMGPQNIQAVHFHAGAVAALQNGSVHIKNKSFRQRLKVSRSVGVNLGKVC